MYSQEENHFYLYLFNTFKTPGSEFIEGGQVVALFTKANLQKVILISYINVIGNIKESMGECKYKKGKELKSAGVLFCLSKCCNGPNGKSIR